MILANISQIKNRLSHRISISKSHFFTDIFIGINIISTRAQYIGFKYIVINFCKLVGRRPAVLMVRSKPAADSSEWKPG